MKKTLAVKTTTKTKTQAKKPVRGRYTPEFKQQVRDQPETQVRDEMKVRHKKHGLKAHAITA